MRLPTCQDGVENRDKIYFTHKGLSESRITRFLLRFEVAGTNVSIVGTKDGGRAAIFACSAKSGEGGTRRKF